MVGAGLERARACVLQIPGCDSDGRLDDSSSDRGCVAIFGRVGAEEVAIGRIPRRIAEPTEGIGWVAGALRSAEAPVSIVAFESCCQVTFCLQRSERISWPSLQSSPGASAGRSAPATRRVVNRGFQETDLGRSEFLWLNGIGTFLVQSPRSKVQGCEHRSAQRQLLPARSSLTKCHPKGKVRRRRVQSSRSSGTGHNRSVRSPQRLEGTKKAHEVGGSKSGPHTLLMAIDGEGAAGEKIPAGNEKRIPAGDGDP